LIVSIKSLNRVQQTPTTKLPQKLAFLKKREQQKMFKRFLSAYSAANDARPFVTKCVTAGALMAVGDMLCQSIEKKIDYNENKKDAGYDWARIRHFGFYGLILNGPMLYATYQHILPAIAPGTSGMQLFKKIMFTQTALTLTSVTAFYICLPLI